MVGARMPSLPNSVSMEVIMVSAWMPWSSSAGRHERSYVLGMDALVTECSQAWMLYGLGIGCSGHQMQSGGTLGTGSGHGC